jgi:hypothetical protein
MKKKNGQNTIKEYHVGNNNATIYAEDERKET